MASPAVAKPLPSPTSSRTPSCRLWSSVTTKRWPPSSTRSCATSSRTTPFPTLSVITTIISPRPISPKLTPTSKRKRISMPRSIVSVSPPPQISSVGPTVSSSLPSRVSTTSVIRPNMRNTFLSWSKARSLTGLTSLTASSTSSISEPPPSLPAVILD